MTIQDEIIRLNRNPELSPWFKTRMRELISYGIYHNQIPQLAHNIADELRSYTEQYSVNTVILGMSGGIDSAVTAALFKNAGWRVVGVTLPIEQNPAETARGIEACKALDIEHRNIDLSTAYRDMVARYTNGAQPLDPELTDLTEDAAKRRGNIRARLRMITLYNLASKEHGIVASTDNFSELAAGFWTLHGGVGDVSPIQAMTKSWEVPALAEHLGVPQSIVEAVPTDGLGIANGDEDQFGFSYLEFDIALFTLMRGGVELDKLTDSDRKIVEAVADRVRSTTYKRANPFNLDHPLDSRRYDDLAQLDIYLRS